MNHQRFFPRFFARSEYDTEGLLGRWFILTPETNPETLLADLVEMVFGAKRFKPVSSRSVNWEIVTAEDFAGAKIAANEQPALIVEAAEAVHKLNAKHGELAPGAPRFEFAGMFPTLADFAAQQTESPTATSGELHEWLALNRRAIITTAVPLRAGFPVWFQSEPAIAPDPIPVAVREFIRDSATAKLLATSTAISEELRTREGVEPTPAPVVAFTSYEWWGGEWDVVVTRHPVNGGAYRCRE